MEAMLQAVIVVFMLFLCSLCLFAIVVIVRDIIHENAKTKRERERDELRDKLDSAQLSELIAMAAAKAEVKEDVTTEDEPQEVVAEPEVESAPDVAEQTAEDENAVVFSRQSLTLEEKYATLSTEFKRHFDDIIFQKNPQTLINQGFGGFSVTNLILFYFNKIIVDCNSSMVLWV